MPIKMIQSFSEKNEEQAKVSPLSKKIGYIRKLKSVHIPSDDLKLKDYLFNGHSSNSLLVELNRRHYDEFLATQKKNKREVQIYREPEKNTHDSIRAHIFTPGYFGKDLKKHF
jgi:hypothetical protein